MAYQASPSRSREWGTVYRAEVPARAPLLTQAPAGAEWQLGDRWIAINKGKVTMKRSSAVISALLVVVFTLGGCSHRPAGDGWVTLIDGEKGLENWDRYGDANWRVEGGAIVADKGKGGFLVTKQSYADFEIYAEFWPDDTANSGIYMRCQDRKNITDRNCYEANIFDQRPDPAYGTGAIQHRGAVPVPNPHKTGGKWNVYEIYVKGSELTVKLNGVVTSSIVNSELKSPGPFALQFGNRGKEPGGVIKWRLVQVRPL